MPQEDRTDTAWTASEIQGLRHELRRLRRNEGIRLHKLEESPLLRRALGVDDVVIARLVLDELLKQDDLFLCLRYAFNLVPPGHRDLTSRQYDYLTAIGRSDLATANRHENEAIKELALMLASPAFWRMRDGISFPLPSLTAKYCVQCGAAVSEGEPREQMVVRRNRGAAHSKPRIEIVTPFICPFDGEIGSVLSIRTGSAGRELFRAARRSSPEPS